MHGNLENSSHYRRVGAIFGCPVSFENYKILERQEFALETLIFLISVQAELAVHPSVKCN